MSRDESVSSGTALAALAICESLLISLVEKGLLDEVEREEILEAALEMHVRAESQRFSRREHEAAAEMIRRVLVRSDALGG